MGYYFLFSIPRENPKSQICKLVITRPINTWACVRKTTSSTRGKGRVVG